MKSLLQVRSSLFGDNGQSSQLVEKFVASWKAKNAGATVVTRDAVNPLLPHLDAATFIAFSTPPEARTEAQRALLKLSDELVAEVIAADVLVLGLPMYNFGISSQLKAWFDHVARAGLTFKYTETGPVGMLAPGKKAYVCSARGGFHPLPGDSQTLHTKNFLTFLGFSSVEFVYAEGLQVGEAIKADSLAKASLAIEALNA